MSIPAQKWAWNQRAGSPSAKLVLMALAEYCDETGRCYPSQATLARRTEQSIDSVQRRLKELVRLGLIQRTPRKRRDGGRSSDLIALLFFPHDVGISRHAPAANCGRGGREDAAGHPALLRQEESSIEPSFNRSTSDDVDLLKTSLDRKPAAVLPKFVSEGALNNVRSIAPGWDRQALLAQFMAWPPSKNAINMDAAFLGWVLKFTKGKPPS